MLYARIKDLYFLRSEGIQTITQLETSLQDTEREIKYLERLRGKADNKRRRASTPEQKEAAIKERRDISRQLEPLRRKQKQKKLILEKAPQLYELLQKEYGAEQKNRERILVRNR